MLQLHHITVHHTRMLWESQTFNTCIPQIHNYSTSMTLISPSPYLKTIIKYQTSHSIQHTQKKVSQILNTKHIIIKQITMLLGDSQNNLSEA